MEYQTIVKIKYKTTKPPRREHRRKNKLIYIKPMIQLITQKSLNGIPAVQGKRAVFPINDTGSAGYLHGENVI